MSGVGTEVEKLIPGWSIRDRKGCSSKSKRLKMNRDGPDKVEAELDEWIEYFLKQKKHLRKALQTIPEPALRWWLALVIRRAIKLARDSAK